MNETYHFIKNRMKELDIKLFHCQNIKLDLEAGQSIQFLKAYNEYLFLVNTNLPSDLIIQSDDNIFFSHLSQHNNAIPIEFTGLLSIEYSSVDPFTLEFIRVIPNN